MKRERGLRAAAAEAAALWIGCAIKTRIIINQRLETTPP